jgi:hypothetical protein
MTEPRRDLGENDVRLTGVIGDIGEKVANSVSHTLHPLVERYAQMFAHGARTPVLRHPNIGLDFEEAFFPSLDGIPLEAWFIPADSDKLLIVDHPMTCNLYGFRGISRPGT